MKIYHQKILKRSILFILFALIVQSILLHTADVPTDPNLGYNVYFTIQNSSRDIFYTIILLVALPSLILMDYYEDLHTSHDNWVITRIGYKSYYAKAILEILIISTIIRFIIEILFITQIQLIKSNIDLTAAVTTHAMFGNQPLPNLISYILCASVGTGILSCFWFSVIYFIKNKYIYRGIMILWLFVSMIGSVAIFSIISGLIGRSDFLKTIMSSISPTSLLGPGTVFESYGFANFLAGFIVYVTAICVLMFITYRKKVHHG